jgi:IS66 Orf2 like protein
MLSLSPAIRIFLCAEAADLRKSFDGLGALVRQALGNDPLSGHWFVFRNRKGDRLKILAWQGDGFALYLRRLERGTFAFPADPPDPTLGEPKRRGPDQHAPPIERTPTSGRSPTCSPRGCCWTLASHPAFLEYYYPSLAAAIVFS